jgi:hypothetical protein
MAVIQQIYNALMEVLGTQDQHEYFSMMMPGLPLSQDEYTPVDGKEIFANKAKFSMSNKMFNVAEVVGGPNGKHLSDVYTDVLDMIIPEIGADQANVMAEVSQWLNEKTEDGSTRLDAFDAAVMEFIVAKQAWDKLQHDQAAELSKVDYETWYSDVSLGKESEIASRRTHINAMIPKSIMSEMVGLVGSDGPAGRVRALRDHIEVLKKETTDGGIMLPVQFEPQDWYTSLSSNFSPIDLLDSPEQIERQIGLKQKEMGQLQGTIDALSAALSAPADVQAASDTLTAAQASYSAAANALQGSYTDSIVTAGKIYLKNKDDDGDKAKFNEEAGKMSEGAEPEKEGSTKKGHPISAEDLEALGTQLNAVQEAQTGFNDAAADVATKGLAWIETANLEDDMGMAEALHGVQSIADDIEHLKKSLMIATKTWPLTKDKVFPRKDAGRFTEVTVKTHKADFSKSTDSSSSFEQTSWSVDLFFGSASGSNSTATSHFSQDVMSDETDIQISMLATKVAVDRAWFKPEYLALTDACKISDENISMGAPTLEEWGDPAKLEKYSDHNLLPAYPTTFLVVKDVTIRFQTASSKGHQARDTLEKHSSVSGGFLCFSASHSEGSKSNQKSVSTSVQGTDVTIRIPGPQVLGWYMQLVPKDQLKQADFSEDGTISRFLKAIQNLKVAEQ